MAAGETLWAAAWHLGPVSSPRRCCFEPAAPLEPRRQATMTFPRRLETELLDVLPADDPAAVRSRSDLRLLNAVMLHPGIMARRMRRHAVDTPRRIIELGAGDGSLMLRLGCRLARHWP